MHKKGTIRGCADGENCLVGSKLFKESGFHSDKVEIFLLKIGPKDYPGKLHIHEKMDEIVVVLKGKFIIEMDGETMELYGGDYVFKTAGSPGRALAAVEGTEVLIIKAPSVGGDVRIIE
jgi:quercetin dioxygenase-like cupin family protein